jgi:hypothetical protein
MGALLAIVRPGLREAVVRHLLGFNAERILDDRAAAGALEPGGDMPR